jgi:ATP adenylyltransferase
MLLTQDGHNRQYEALDQDDWQALHSVLRGQTDDYVAFYNCGQDGGCSRLHKHMQLIPKPKDSFAAFLDEKDAEEPDMPFHWFYHRFDSANLPSEDLLDVYNELLEKATEVGAGLSENVKRLPHGAAIPHNMLVTKKWMVVLPRRRAAVNKEAGANALGMMGVIAVATQREIDNWINIGPSKALEELGVPKKASTT